MNGQLNWFKGGLLLGAAFLFAAGAFAAAVPAAILVYKRK